jgi:hypothetical protein
LENSRFSRSWNPRNICLSKKIEDHFQFFTNTFLFVIWEMYH